MAVESPAQKVSFPVTNKVHPPEKISTVSQTVHPKVSVTQTV